MATTWVYKVAGGFLGLANMSPFRRPMGGSMAGLQAAGPGTVRTRAQEEVAEAVCVRAGPQAHLTHGASGLESAQANRPDCSRERAPGGADLDKL